MISYFLGPLTLLIFAIGLPVLYALWWQKKIRKLPKKSQEKIIDAMMCSGCCQCGRKK